MRDIRGWQTLPVPGRPRVSITVATFEQGPELACLLYSFIAQTYENWEAVVVHDGPGPIARDVIAKINDPRIRLIETSERKSQFGHPWRQMSIDQCTGDFIGMTNGDNYYVPVYFEWMLHILMTHQADVVYCNWIHSHTQWSMMTAGPGRRLIDLGCWIARAGLVKTTPWWDFGFEGDGTYFEDLIRKSNRVIHLPKPLFVHN